MFIYLIYAPPPVLLPRVGPIPPPVGWIVGERNSP